MKISIYAGPPIQSVMVGYEDNRSGRLNTVAERYQAIVAAHTPTMSEAEWCAVCDALNGHYVEAGDGLTGIRYAWACVEDCDGLGDKWGIDQAALVARLRAMPLADLVAMAEVVQRFWQRTDLPAREALERAGARIASAKA